MIIIKYGLYLLLTLLMAQRVKCPLNCPSAPGDFLRTKRAIKVAWESSKQFCFIKNVTPIIGIIVDPTKKKFDEAYYVVDQDHQVYRLGRKFGDRLDAFVSKEAGKYDTMAKGMAARGALWAVGNTTQTFVILANSTDIKFDEHWKHATVLKSVTMYIGKEKPDWCDQGEFFYMQTHFAKGFTRNYSHQVYDRVIYLRRQNDYPYKDANGNDLKYYYYWFWYFKVVSGVDRYYKQVYIDEWKPCYIFKEEKSFKGWVINPNGKYGYYNSEWGIEEGMYNPTPNGFEEKRRRNITYSGTKKPVTGIKLFVFTPNMPKHDHAYFILDSQYKNFSLRINNKIELVAKPEKYINSAMVDSVRSRRPICAITNSSYYYWALELAPKWDANWPVLTFCKYFLYYGQDSPIEFDYWKPPDPSQDKKNKDWRVFVIPVIDTIDRIEYYDFLLNLSAPAFGSRKERPLITFNWQGQRLYDITDWETSYIKSYDSVNTMPYYIIKDNVGSIAYIIFKNGTYTTISMTDLEEHRIWNWKPYSARYIRVFRPKSRSIFG